MSDVIQQQGNADLGRAQFESNLLDFCERLFRAIGFKINAELCWAEGMLFLDFTGRDTEDLLANRSELVMAVEYLLNKVFQNDSNLYGMINCDVQGKKQTRLAELQLIARTAAEKVRETRVPFRLNPMDSRERRIVHLALANDETIRTESEGEGEFRKVVIYPAG